MGKVVVIPAKRLAIVRVKPAVSQNPSQKLLLLRIYTEDWGSRAAVLFSQRGDDLKLRIANFSVARAGCYRFDGFAFPNIFF